MHKFLISREETAQFLRIWPRWRMRSQFPVLVLLAVQKPRATQRNIHIKYIVFRSQKERGGTTVEREGASIKIETERRA